MNSIQLSSFTRRLALSAVRASAFALAAHAMAQANKTVVGVAIPSATHGFTGGIVYWANQAKLPFANRHAASLRAIYDLADPEQSLFIYQTGQSGLVFSGRYRDMSQQWAQVGYRSLRLAPQAWAHEARLTP